VEVGKRADLIVVGANPLDDITNVRRLQLVLKEGRVVSDKRHPSGAGPQPEVPS
jgi:imidazolonepropionase-like amidohydrolase